MPSTDWKEIVHEGEAARLLRHAEHLRQLQRAHARGRKPDRALHAKANAALIAELTVLDDLPEHARKGLFATPATYPAFLRYSNGSGVRQPDGRPDVRGLAIKLVGVPGKKVIVGLEGKKTQDFLLIRTPTTPFRNADEFVAVVRAAQNRALLLPRLIAGVGLGRAVRLIRDLVRAMSVSMSTLASTPYYSALPIQYGPYAVKFELIPRDPPTPATKSPNPDALGDELAERLRLDAVVYDFRVRFFRSEEDTPIEDASVEWREPPLTVAQLTIPKQDVASSRGRRIAELVERLSFDPWHALVEHRPLGEMMRARNEAYRLSTEERAAAPEPDEIDLPP